MLLRKKEEIEAWLNQYNIQNYELIEDKNYGYVINVNGHVGLLALELKNIDVKFNKINGSFNCSFNELETLEGCPEIVNGDFFCENNNLKSLKNGPNVVDGCYYCHNNKLETLIGASKIINGNFFCSNNKLISLEGCPEIIEKEFLCYNNELTIKGLKYLPKKIKSNYINIYKNKELSDLQNIELFNTLKEKVNEILKIKEEKEKLSNLIIDLNKKKINKI